MVLRWWECWFCVDVKVWRMTVSSGEAAGLLIKGGRVVDGTGSLPYAADVRVRDGRIVEIGADLAAGSDTVPPGMRRAGTGQRAIQRAHRMHPDTPF